MLKKNFAAEQKKGLEIKIGDRTVFAEPKVFSTGSVGFLVNAKVPVTLDDGTVVNVQLGGNFIVTKSKEMVDDTDLSTGKVVEPEKVKHAPKDTNGQPKVKLAAGS